MLSRTRGEACLDSDRGREEGKPDLLPPALPCVPCDPAPRPDLFLTLPAHLIADRILPYATYQERMRLLSTSRANKLEVGKEPVLWLRARQTLLRFLRRIPSLRAARGVRRGLALHGTQGILIPRVRGHESACVRLAVATDPCCLGHGMLLIRDGERPPLLAQWGDFRVAPMGMTAELAEGTLMCLPRVLERM